ncbi:unnamed protein product [Phytomonas sp. EM1]|nr:unnamed protein product [Phytomonas sp. EM1]|eukprot:CCW62174.1 unnamed protein product [Phytomonas sp. isolate EM1]
MDFDDLTEQISFEKAVARARSHILQASSASGNFDELISKYSAFKDISREAKKRGKLISSVLVAAEGIVRSFSPSPEVSSSETSLGSYVCSEDEEKLLRLLLTMYMHLYSNNPVPTRQQWSDAVYSTISGAFDKTSMRKDFKFNGHTPLQSSYTTALFEVFCTSRGTVNCEEESDDGSFVDSQFISYLKRLLVLGRKNASRGGFMNPAESGKPINEMLRAVRQFVNSNTIDW